MSKKLWIGIAVGGIVLLGLWASQKDSDGACNAGICKVEVSVVECNVTVRPEPLEVRRPRREKNIHWDIVDRDYIFAANGIVFKTPNDEFDLPELKDAGKKFKWHDKHTKEGKYKYSVNVIKTGGVNPRVCPTHDPVISNE